MVHVVVQIKCEFNNFIPTPFPPTPTPLMASDTAPLITKQILSGDQEDSCANTTMSGDMFTSEGTVSSGPNTFTKRDRSQRPSFGCGCGNCTFLSYIENGCPDPIPKTSSFPCVAVSRLTHEQKQELRSRLRVESQDIMFKFQQLLFRVYESLRERKICVGRLVTHLWSSHLDFIAQLMLTTARSYMTTQHLHSSKFTLVNRAVHSTA